MSKMFQFITHTWNPLIGACSHNCKGCWAKDYINRLNMTKYQGKPDLDMVQIYRKFKPGSFVFVCSMVDLFAKDVPMEAINIILKQIEKQPEVTFLLLTKNPRFMWLWELPKNVVAGATIESDWNHLTSLAPEPSERIKAMIELVDNRKMVSIEPIMKFSMKFIDYLKMIHPEFVAVGYDNYHNCFDEPTLAETEKLIKQLEDFGIKVYRKTIREPMLVAK